MCYAFHTPYYPPNAKKAKKLQIRNFLYYMQPF
nr:MAG TPA: hypothetical protein [Bacteriophage sp.]